MITSNDISRLLAELAESAPDDIEDWCEMQGIESEVIAQVIETLQMAMITWAIENGVKEAIGSSLFSAFVLGWETNEQYGKPRERSNR